MRRVAALTIALLLFGACSEDRSFREDDSARVPSATGVATDVTFERIQIDGRKTYNLRSDVESFTTRSKTVTPLLSWEGKYVHIGLDDDDNVLWVAGIGIVSGKPPAVTYSGVFESFDSSTRTATFEDGTVLELARSIEAPESGGEVIVQIDVGSDLATKFN